MSDIGKSVTQFIIEQQRAHPSSTGEMTGLLNDLVSACKKISHLVNRSGIIGLGGALNLKISKVKFRKSSISLPMMS